MVRGSYPETTMKSNFFTIGFTIGFVIILMASMITLVLFSDSNGKLLSDYSCEEVKQSLYSGDCLGRCYNSEIMIYYLEHECEQQEDKKIGTDIEWH